MRYRCKKELTVEKYEDNGFSTEDTITIEEGSIWDMDDSSSKIIGGEVRLENTESLEWLEICNKTLQDYFETISPKE